jgi:hypothetical protein
VQDFVRVSVADAGEKPRVGERALERVVFLRELLPEGDEICLEHFHAARVERTQRRFALHEV